MVVPSSVVAAAAVDVAVNVQLYHAHAYDYDPWIVGKCQLLHNICIYRHKSTTYMQRKHKTHKNHIT